MGLYLRKSVRVGPFRFNLSGAGIGVSCGIPGLRVGTGPRGNHISAGKGGIYYRKTFPDSRRAPLPVKQPPTSDAPNDPTLGAFQRIEGGMSLAMHDASSAGLLDELNQKRKRWRLTPWLVTLAVLACMLSAYEDGPTAFLIAAMGLFGAAIGIAAMRDAVRKTSMLLWEIRRCYQISYDTIGYEHN